MGDNLLSQESGSWAGMRPLTSSNAGGQSYTRRATVETEIQKTLLLRREEWAGAAPLLQSETLVYLIRHIRRSSVEWRRRPSEGATSGLIYRILQAHEDLLGQLVSELSARIGRISTRLAQGFDEVTSEEIVWKVDTKILELILEERPSRPGEFLEVAFNKAVQGRAIDAVRKHKNSVTGHRDQMAGTVQEHDADGDELRPLEVALDQRPGPLEHFLEEEDEARTRQLVQKAWDAVKDPRDRKAVRLHFMEGLQVKDLVRHFNKSERQIRNRINAALNAMRAAIGGQK